MPALANKVIKGHNLRTVKMTLPKFPLDLSFVVIFIVYKFHNSKTRQT